METLTEDKTCAPENGLGFSRHSELNVRHRELGADLSTAWNDMPIPQSYATNAYDEIATTRYRAGLIDVSGLRILNVSGRQATEFLDYLLTSDIRSMRDGQSHISNIVDDDGGLIDDVLVYCDGPNKFRVSHGGGHLEEAMSQFAPSYDVNWSLDDDVHILSLQGPLARSVLQPHVNLDLKSLPYFSHKATQAFGRRVSIARGGYSGEMGYEFFCARKDAVSLWDAILEAGKPYGVTPVSWDCLDIGRVEAGLLFFPFDMPHEKTTPWEVRADWTVNLDKADFRGKSALVQKKGKERSFITGLEVDASIAMTPGSRITKNGQEIGVVTSTTFSQHLMKSLAMAQISPAHTALGTAVSIHDDAKVYPATIVRTPFYDPLRFRTHPIDER
jgi:glycine cleavage system T protein (aminomethyltransferase)